MTTRIHPLRSRSRQRLRPEQHAGREGARIHSRLPASCHDRRAAACARCAGTGPGGGHHLRDRRAGPRQLRDGWLCGAIRRPEIRCGRCAACGRCLVRGQTLRGQPGRRRGGSHHDRRSDPNWRGYCGHAGTCDGLGRRGQDPVRAADGAERARGRLRYRARPGRVPARPVVAPRRDRHDRLAGYRRGVRVSAIAGRLLLHRRRAGAGRPAARRRADLRQQSLHAIRHARAAGGRQHRLSA